MKSPTRTKAKADPTKTFFVDMITRDISLEDCILDLIDNSVDQALRTVGSDRMGIFAGPDLSSFAVDVSARENSFSITDNCGGMSEEAAAEYAFNFGRKPGSKQGKAGVGIYGIGMKRAVFKIGRDIVVRSTHTDEDGEQVAFRVPIEVDEWLTREEPTWEFDIEADSALPEDGVSVDAKRLTRAASRAFSTATFIETLGRMIARDYTLHLRKGLRITVNERRLEGLDLSLRSGDGLRPIRTSYEDQVSGVPVSVEIVGGMAAAPPDDLEADESESLDPSGWYVACNGRIVLAADKTSTTGWELGGFPRWHTQYTGFIGLIGFQADPAVLPLTTTKRNVDGNSDLYRRALLRMQQVSRDWINYTNARRNDIPAARAVETAARPVPIQRVTTSEFAFPAFKKSGPKLANVNYSVPADKMQRLAVGFGDPSMKYRDVGRESFDYAYKDLVEPE